MSKSYTQPIERREIISDTCVLARDCTDDELIDAVRDINAQAAAAAEADEDDEGASLSDVERAEAAKLTGAHRARFIAARLARRKSK